MTTGPNTEESIYQDRIAQARYFEEYSYELPKPGDIVIAMDNAAGCPHIRLGAPYVVELAFERNFPCPACSRNFALKLEGLYSEESLGFYCPGSFADKRTVPAMQWDLVSEINRLREAGMIDPRMLRDRYEYERMMRDRARAEAEQYMTRPIYRPIMEPLKSPNFNPFEDISKMEVRYERIDPPKPTGFTPPKGMEADFWNALQKYRKPRR